MTDHGPQKQLSGAAKIEAERNQVDDPTCPSCGVAYHEHPGLVLVCAKLQSEMHNKAALEAFIAKLESKRSHVAQEVLACVGFVSKACMFDLTPSARRSLVERLSVIASDLGASAAQIEEAVRL